MRGMEIESTTVCATCMNYRYHNKRSLGTKRCDYSVQKETTISDRVGAETDPVYSELEDKNSNKDLNIHPSPFSLVNDHIMSGSSTTIII